jgi:uncharacterized protein
MAVLSEDMKRVVREQSLAFVATTCPDGTPNLSPKGTISIWDDDHLIFVDLASPTTMANLARNPAVEINVVDPVVRKGYRFKGTASVHTAGAGFEDAARFYALERGLEQDRIHGVAIISVESAAELISPSYDRGATEQEVVDRFVHRWEEVYGWKIERT